jgi:hypothetical protein
MKQLTCEMCGGTDLIKQDGVFVCQSCGCKYSVEEAKKMMIEGNVDVSGSTVKIDNSAEIEYLNDKLNRSVEIKDYDSMLRISDELLRINKDNPDALFIYGYALACIDETSINETVVYAREALTTQYRVVGENEKFYDFATTVLTKLYKLINVCYEDYVNGTYSQSYQMNQENSQQKAIEEYARTGKKQDASLLEIAGNALMAKIDSKAAASNFNNIVATELIKLIDSIYNLKLEGFYNAKHEFLLAFLNILKMKNELDTSLLTKESIQRDIQALEKINTNNTEVINLKRSILGKLNQMNTKIERTGEIKSNKDKKGNKVADLAWVGFGLIMLFLGVVLNNEIMIVVGLSFMFLLGIGFIFSLFTKNTKNNDVSINKNIDLDEIKRLAATDKVQAIKAYRELYNADLAEAKEAVEKMINQ